MLLREQELPVLVKDGEVALCEEKHILAGASHLRVNPHRFESRIAFVREMMSWSNWRRRDTSTRVARTDPTGRSGAESSLHRSLQV